MNRILEVNHLSVDFLTDGVWVPTVTDVSFHLNEGELLALVGESGCGKSVTCMSLARLLSTPPARISSGSILLKCKDGVTRDILRLSQKDLRKIRGGEISYIFQEPSVSLNPVFRIGEQIQESITLHCPDVKDPVSESIKLLEQVGIPDPTNRIKQYPHELSGGMQQRVMIAMALASRPSVLVADEPTTALDVTIQAQILDLLNHIRKERNMSVILVTHNLGIVAELADRMAVMYAGRIMEESGVSEVLNHPLHPYTRSLISAIPVLGSKHGKLNTIPGTVPSPCEFRTGCRFLERCGRYRELPEDLRQICLENPPEYQHVTEHYCSCNNIKTEIFK